LLAEIGRNVNRPLILAIVALAVPAAHAQTFKPGDVYARNPNGQIWNVTAGGDFTAVAPFLDLPDTEIGDMAWSLDRSVMYVSDYQSFNVWAVTAAGSVSTFATGLVTPSGLLMTADGRLLVAEFSSGTVADITAGGDFTGAPRFARGIESAGPVGLAQLADGRIFVSENSHGEVYDNTSGGSIGPARLFAMGLGAVGDLETAAGGAALLASPVGAGTIYSISSTGTTSVFGVGSVGTLAYAPGGKLLGGSFGPVDTPEKIYDVTAGGDLTAAPQFALVPVGVQNLSSVPVPEPASLCLLALGGACALWRRHRHPVAG
jgi:hypothetical protein